MIRQCVDDNEQDTCKLKNEALAYTADD